MRIPIVLFCFLGCLAANSCSHPNGQSLPPGQLQDSLDFWQQPSRHPNPSPVYRFQQLRRLSARHQIDSLWYTYTDSLRAYYYRQQQFPLFYRVNMEYLTQAEKQYDTLHSAQAHQSLGTYYFKVEMYDSAYYHYNQARFLYRFTNDSLQIGRSLLNMAIVTANVGDYHDSEATAHEALDYFSAPSGAKYRIRAYNNLAVTSNRLGQYKEADFWMEKVSKSRSTPEHQIMYLNNRGVVARNRKDFDLAQSYFEQAAARMLSQTPARIRAMVLDNIGYNLMQTNDTSAFDYLWKAYNIRRLAPNRLGLIVSLLNLGSWYQPRDTVKAQFYYKKAVAESQSIGDVRSHILALTSLSRLNSKTTYQQQLRHLNDSLARMKKELRYRFAQIKYRVDKQEAENKWLRQAYNEQLFLIAQQKNKAQITYILLGALSVLCLLFVLFFRLRIKHNQQQMRIDKLKIRADEKDRLALYLHDDVANDLLVGLQKSEQLLRKKKNNNWSRTIDHFDLAYEKIRKIAQYQSQQLAEHIPFLKRLTDLTQQIAFRHKTHYEIKGLEALDWQALPTVMRHAIFNVIREALLNITKHAQATEVGIELTQKGKFWSLQIWDNGKGISQDRSTGLGLLHMKKSIQEMGGSLHLMEAPQGGTVIAIKLTGHEFKKRN